MPSQRDALGTTLALGNMMAFSASCFIQGFSPNADVRALNCEIVALHTQNYTF